MNPTSTPTTKPKQQKPDSTEEQRAAMRRLLGSFRANLDAVRDAAGAQQKALEARLEQVQSTLSEMESRGYLDDNARKIYRQLTQEMAMLDKLAPVAGEIFDRADLAIPTYGNRNTETDNPA